MLGFIIFILQAPPGRDVVALPVGLELGVKVVLENTVFEEGKQVKWATRIMKVGNKLRIENTFPNSHEISEVIIWDGKQCNLFLPNHEPQKIHPIRNAMEFIGFTEGIEEKNVKWEMDKVNKVPLKKKTLHEITEYKDYMMIENFGYFPSVIEVYENKELGIRTELKHIEQKVELKSSLFDPKSVEFSEEAKKLAKELYPE